MKLEKGSIITVDLKNPSSNTFFIDTVENTSVLVSHPLSGEVLIRVPINMINTVGANIKDSTERCIDYANTNKKFLDYNTVGDLEGLGIYFVLKRQLTPRQKLNLANICGVIASVKFNNDIRTAMDFISKNSTLLDDFNQMWFNNFSGLFNGKQPITSKKQRSAIFNIAGYLLAELENPTTGKQK